MGRTNNIGFGFLMLALCCLIVTLAGAIALHSKPVNYSGAALWVVIGGIIASAVTILCGVVFRWRATRAPSA